MALLLVLLALLASYANAQCPSFCSCRNTRVRCSGGGATEVPNFPNDTRQAATIVELGNNDITSIRATDFQGFVNLERLELSSNQISSIEEGSFSSNTALDYLDLSFNQLREIPDNLFQSTSLFTLDLSSNLIANVSSSTFIGVQADSSIFLADNVLRTLPENTFDSVGSLHELSLTGNPIRCDCELRWFPNFRSSIRSLASIGTCDVPANLNGMSLEFLTEEQFVCDCSPACVNGTCNMTVGTCVCNDGYIGDICDTPCPVGTFGAGCLQNCTCLSDRESAPCDSVDGSCHCLPGYTGPSCDQECPDGFYGQDCMDVCDCENGDCHFITGFCNCSIGYMGVACDMICPPLRYGLGCSEVCSCETGNCHHITGNCSCPVGYFGMNCDHNCTEASDCADIGREDCSIDTPEQTCGSCLEGYVGEAGNGNSECILCSGAPNCTGLNREPCTRVRNTCGSCFHRHLGEEGFSNEPCFDPCIDGIMNHNETDVDCGGPLCPPCDLNQACSSGNDCGVDSVCLGVYSHPSGLDFPFNVQENNTCVASDQPGNAIAERFVNALQGRENPLQDILENPDFTLDALEESVGREISEQFNVQEPLEFVSITELDQEPGDPLYQASIKFAEEANENIDQMIQNMHDGKLLGTMFINRKSRNVLHNV